MTGNSFGYNAADSAEQARKFEYWGRVVGSEVVEDVAPSGKSSTYWKLLIESVSVISIDSATKQVTPRIMRLRIQDSAGRQISKESPAALVIRKWKELGADFGPQGDNANAPLEFCKARPQGAVRFNAYFMPTGGLIKEGTRAGQPYGEFVEEPVAFDPAYTPPANIGTMEVKVPDFLKGSDPAAQGAQATVTPVAANLSPEQIDEEILALLDGSNVKMDSSTMQKVMAKIGSGNADLLNEVVTGGFARRMVEAGRLNVNGEIYQLAAAAAAEVTA